MTTKLNSLSKLALVVSAVAAFSIGCNNNNPTTGTTTSGGSTGGAAGGTTGGGTTGGANGGTTGGTGTPALTASPTTLAFNSVDIGATSNAQLVTITNSGTGTTKAIAAAISGTNASEFTLSANGCTTPLAANASCTVSLTFSPTAAGAATGTLTITSGTVNAAVALTGTGSSPASLSLSPNSQPFGSLTDGTASTPVTFTVTNTGTAASGSVSAIVSGTNAADFVIGTNTCGAALAAAATCTFQVTFTPSIVGAESGTLSVSASPGGSVQASLTGTGTAIGQPGLSISPNSYPFGSLTVGSVSAAETFTVTNTGTAASGVPAVSLVGGDATQFTLGASTCTVAIAAGGTCTVAVTFSPTSAGSYSASLSVTTAPGGTATAGLTGTAASNAALSIAPNFEGFGTIAQGSTSSPVPFTVTNTGASVSGTLAATVTGANLADFVIGTDNCAGQTLAPNGTCTVTVSFKPSLTSSENASLNVTGAPGGTATSSLSGSGAAPAALSINPNPHSYGSLAVGAASAATQFVITNNGAVATGALSWDITGANAGDFAVPNGAANNTCQGAILAANATCTISITFTASAAIAESATLNVSGSPGGTATSSLSGTGLAPAQLTVTPGSQNFGSVLDTFSSQAVTFTVGNSGGIATGVPGAAISGNNAGDFAITANNCTAALSPTATSTCTVQVTFTASAVGNESATLTVTGSPGGSAIAGLSGTGLNSNSVFFIPSSQNFGTVVVGGKSSAVTFQVFNGTSASVIFEGDIFTTGGANFTVTGGTCPTTTTLNPSASCTFTVEYTPTSVGAGQAATLEAEYVLLPFTLYLPTTSLTGTAVNEFSVTAPVTVVPNTFDFGSVAAGVTVTQAFTFTNNYSASLTLPTVAQGGAVAFTAGTYLTVLSNTCDGAVVTAGGSCQVTVQYAVPAGAAGGVDTAFLTLNTPSNQPVGVNFTADTETVKGTPTGALTVSTATLAFGSVTDGTVVSKSFTVSCAAPAPGCGTIETSLANSTPAAFGITADGTGGVELTSANSPQTVTVSFFPGSFTGALGGTISLTGSVTGGATVDLTGTGTTPGSLTVSSNSPGGSGTSASPWGLGSADPGGTGTIYTFTVTNIGTQSVGAVSVAIATGGTDFTLVNTGAGSCAVATTGLVGGGSCTFTVAYSPGVNTAPGLEQGSVGVTTGGSSATAFVEGLATSPLGIAPQGTTLAPYIFSAGQELNVTTPTQNFTVSSSVVTGALSATLSQTGTDFKITTNGCATGIATAGNTCTVTIDFTPTVTATETATLTVTDVGATGRTVSSVIQGTGLTTPSFTVSPASYVYGGMLVGSPTAAITYTFTNSGQTASGAVVATVVGTNAADFNISANGCAAAMAPNGTCTVGLNFNPGAVGARSASLQLKDANGVIGAAAVSGTGLVAGSAFISPTPYSYGFVTQGASANNTFTLTNGGAATSISSIATSGAADFTVTGGTCAVGALGAGASCTVIVKYGPTASSTGNETGTLTVATGNGSPTAALYGSAQNPVNLVATPSSYNFGFVGNGNTAASSLVTPITIKNTGSVASGVIVHPLVFTGTNPNQFTFDGAATKSLPTPCFTGVWVALAPGASCGLVLDFKATQVGGASASVAISDSTSSASVSIALSGTGVTTANITISPSGTQTLAGAAGGNVGAPTLFTITNPAGSAPTGPLVDTFGNSQIQVVSGGSCVFSATTGTQLAAGQSCTVNVQEAPNAYSGAPAGPFLINPGFTVSDSTNGSNSVFVELNISVTATLTFAPATLNYATTKAGASAAAQTVTLTNNGLGATGTLVTTLSDPNDFTVETDGCVGTALAPGASCSLSVVFNPVTTGALAATLTETSAATLSVPSLDASAALTGTGN